MGVKQEAGTASGSAGREQLAGAPGGSVRRECTEQVLGGGGLRHTCEINSRGSNITKYKFQQLVKPSKTKVKLSKTK